ncbi:MAG: hypothetical protein NVS4B11_29340 [Ktedonobacteraceae bacterium]
MNKTKRVAWHKHLRGEKKYKEKQRQAQKAGIATSSATPTSARSK